MRRVDEMVSLRLPPDVMATIRAVAEREERSMSQVTRRLILVGLAAQKVGEAQ